MQAKKLQKKKKYKRVESGFSRYRNEIFGLILFAFGVLALFSFLFSESMGVFGKAITSMLLGFLGVPAFLIPVVLIVYGVAMIFKKDSHTFKLRVIYLGVLILLVSCFWQVAEFKYDDYAGRAFYTSLVDFYRQGTQINGGGLLGGLVTLPFLMTFQILGTIIILTTISIIDIILLTNISMAAFLSNVSAFLSRKFRAANDARKSRKAERIKERQAEAEGDEDVLREEKVSEVEKRKIINFKIERESRANRVPKKLGSSAEDEAAAARNSDTLEMSAEEEAFTVSLTGFNDDIAEDMVVADIKGMGISPEGPGVEATDPDSEEGVKEGNTPSANAGPAGNEDLVIPQIEQQPRPLIYNYPSLDLLDESRDDATNVKALKNSALEGAKKLEDTLKSFGVEARVINISRGPAVTRYEIQPSPGVKVSKIVNLSDDIALNLAAAGVRIEAPIPGKAAVGIEVPNKEMSSVLLKDILESKEFTNHSSKLAFSVGKDISGETVVADIGKMPHLLVAGATGSGKSVCINSLIMSILFKASPEEVKLLMVDPKVVELGIYNGIPHLLIPVVTDPKKAAGALNWAVQEMVNRYKLFADKGVRDLKGYNAMLKANDEPGALPHIVIIVDELADLMMVAPNDVEDAICRLAQMARAAGMHLVIATQRPSVDVITGVIKANIPSRISFAVSSQVDSRTILDMGGAEKLLGRGDMLFYPVGEPKPLRVKGSFVSDSEVEKVVEYIKTQGYTNYDENIIERINDQSSGNDDNSGDNDELLNQAIDMVVEAGQASVSLVQRKFKVGYSRAARIIDQMEARNIVGRFEGSKPRQVLISKQQWMELQMNEKDRQSAKQQ
ncbi:DNA translocase SpoIIIE [Ruminiclostridium hungatei]|uniref:DNA translocase SpoIIIE n=1 Tax=Ruminiclostridium hungatei TaxID=48256 RepID=A0A1V4SH72_RUMHU|nr:DNA translocase FtsK [Ruminiclostridium hungatei]OPX43239.1 DNA translocase SpoIIIE [Ruminiclostridium hungatei]